MEQLAFVLGFAAIAGGFAAFGAIAENREWSRTARAVARPKRRPVTNRF